MATDFDRWDPRVSLILSETELQCSSIGLGSFGWVFVFLFGGGVLVDRQLPCNASEQREQEEKKMMK